MLMALGGRIVYMMGGRDEAWYVKSRRKLFLIEHKVMCLCVYGYVPVFVYMNTCTYVHIDVRMNACLYRCVCVFV